MLFPGTIIIECRVKNYETGETGDIMELKSRTSSKEGKGAEDLVKSLDGKSMKDGKERSWGTW